MNVNEVNVSLNVSLSSGSGEVLLTDRSDSEWRCFKQRSSEICWGSVSATTTPKSASQSVESTQLNQF